MTRSESFHIGEYKTGNLTRNLLRRDDCEGERGSRGSSDGGRNNNEGLHYHDEGRRNNKEGGRGNGEGGRGNGEGNVVIAW